MTGDESTFERRVLLLGGVGAAAAAVAVASGAGPSAGAWAKPVIQHALSLPSAAASEPQSTGSTSLSEE